MSSRSNTYERHVPEIMAFLRRRLWNREEAEDLCQETFVRALQAEDRLRDRSKLRPYLLRIAHNLVLNHLRRRQVVTSESDLGEGIDLEGYGDTARDNPEADVEWSELNQRLHDLLVQLTPELRTAFELGVLQRRPYAEIARRQGWSLAKVKINVYRARKQLMTGLRDYLPPATRQGTESAGRETP